MNRIQGRKCRICCEIGKNDTGVKIQRQRLDILSKWYPELKTPDDWVHRSCLAALGLHPFPREEMPLQQIIGEKLIKRVHELVEAQPATQGPLQLVDAVYKQLQREVHAPTTEGQQQLRFLVSNWVTTKCGGNRSGVVVEDDCRPDGAPS